MPNPSWSPNGVWTSVFDDEFPGSSLDTTKWAPGWFGSSGVTGPINSNETVKYNSTNVTVSGSICSLALTSTQGSCISTNPQFASPGFTFTPPAAFEARILLPQDPTSPFGVDNWPAFWSDTTGSWPAGVEVDVMEGLGDFAAYHIHDSSGGPGANVGSVTSYVGAFHTFGANWASDGTISFYYDGVLVGTEVTVNKSPGTHYLICNYTTSSTPDPAVMQVDWVRCWTPGGTGGSGSNQTGMVVTAACSGAGAANGIAMTVVVLNGAAGTQTGATAATETATVPDLAITPVSSGSLIFGGMIYNASSNKFTPLASSTFTQNATDTVNGVTYGVYQSAAVTTASSPVTLGSLIPTGTSGEILIAQAEIQGTAMTIDPSTPIPAYTTSAKTLSTAGFSPPGGALIVAQVASDYSGTGAITTAVSDSTGLTWTKLISSGTKNAASIWIAGTATGTTVTGPPPTPTGKNLIVSIAPSGGTDPVTGQAYPAGIQVGEPNNPQIALIPSGGAAEVAFPMPIQLSNVPNLAGAVAGVLGQLVLSGPALPNGGVSDDDWVQLVMWSDGTGVTSARGELRYVPSGGGAATVVLTWDTGGLLLTAQNTPATPPSGTVRLFYQGGALKAKGPSGNVITIATT